MRSKLLIRTSDGAEFSTERPSQQYVVEYHRGLSISKRHTGRLQPAAGLPLAGDKPGCPMLIRPLSALNALSDAGDKPQRTLLSGPRPPALHAPELWTLRRFETGKRRLERRS